MAELSKLATIREPKKGFGDDSVVIGESHSQVMNQAKKGH